MGWHWDALGQPEVSVTDQVHLLLFFLPRHRREIIEVILDLIPVHVARLQIDQLTTMPIDLMIDLLFLVFTFILEVLVKVEFRQVKVEMGVLAVWHWWVESALFKRQIGLGCWDSVPSWLIRLLMAFKLQVMLASSMLDHRIIRTSRVPTCRIVAFFRQIRQCFLPSGWLIGTFIDKSGFFLSQIFLVEISVMLCSKDLFEYAFILFSCRNERCCVNMEWRFSLLLKELIFLMHFFLECFEFTLEIFEKGRAWLEIRQRFRSR